MIGRAMPVHGLTGEVETEKHFLLECKTWNLYFNMFHNFRLINLAKLKPLLGEGGRTYLIYSQCFYPIYRPIISFGSAKNPIYWIEIYAMIDPMWICCYQNATQKTTQQLQFILDIFPGVSALGCIIDIPKKGLHIVFPSGGRPFLSMTRCALALLMC